MVYSSFIMLTITIDRVLEDPVYAQVAQQLRQSIASGALVPGTALPSVRRLAGDLGVNLNTIARAYRLLEEEGFLVIRGRSGAKVAPPASRVERSAPEQLMAELRATLARLRQAGVTGGELVEVVQQEIHAMDRQGGENFDE